jgi:predicted transcriptional regulator
VGASLTGQLGRRARRTASFWVQSGQIRDASDQLGPYNMVCDRIAAGARMHAQTAKQEAIETIERLPDDVPLDEIVYRLYVLSKIHTGLQDIDAGRVVPSAQLAREIEQW